MTTQQRYQVSMTEWWTEVNSYGGDVGYDNWTHNGASCDLVLLLLLYLTYTLTP